ncbi:hypothetical protein VTO73DRAFT_13618 [Trametes versicolor]
MSLNALQWSLVHSTPGKGRTFSRTLGPAEHCFYYDRIMNGTADVVWHYTLELADPTQGSVLFGQQNVSRAWATVKQHYPLLGSRMEPQPDGTVKFFVEERALSRHTQDELTICIVHSADEVAAIIEEEIRDKTVENNQTMARTFVLARADRPGTYEVLFRMAHVISDGISGATLARTFFDVLSSPPIQTPALEKRLATALPSDVLNPSLKLSLARQRWRRAIAKVCLFHMSQRLTGSHTLPQTITEETYRTPAKPARAVVCIDTANTRKILDSCKKHKVTFGAAMPVIAQMALTRLLHRRYLRGDISAAEWEHRRRQPMNFASLFNLRPYLDEAWQRAGGVAEVLLMIEMYNCALPFMPTPYGSRRDAWVPREDGAPPYSVLLSRARFFHRVERSKQQLARAVKHPLLLEMAHARQPPWVARQRKVATHWQAAAKGEPLPAFPELDVTSSEYGMTAVVSSVGDLSPILPSTYPLPPTHPLCIRTAHDPPSVAYGATRGATTSTQSTPPPSTTAFRMVNYDILLHARPAELLVGSTTVCGQIHMALTYDANVYRAEDTEEYLNECLLAALYYFGTDVPSAVKGKL